MSTRFDKKSENENSIILGYENSGSAAENISIPSCGIEDLDRSVFDLFDKSMPLYYKLDEERKKVPVIFAAGERYAIGRRKTPITDSEGVIILPVISIGRSSIDMSNQAGIANNEMFPITFQRIHKKSNEERILKNTDEFKNVLNSSELEKNINLNPEIENNIIETIQLPPAKSFTAKYEIVIWSSFAKQMNGFIETIMSSFYFNPGYQVRLESPKGYWFVGRFDQSISQDANFNSFTDQERYIKQTFNLTATGYIFNPSIDTVTSIKSYQSPNNISFDFYSEYDATRTNEKGIKQGQSQIVDDSDFAGSQLIGVESLNNELNFYKDDKSGSFTTYDNIQENMHDDVAGWSTEFSKERKTWILNEKGEKVPVQAKKGKNGETIYDQKYAELLFNVSSYKK